MLRIITPEPAAASYVETETWRPEACGDEFEIVIGKRQVASLLFVGIVVVAIASGLSYVVGRAAGMKDTARAAPVTQAAAPPPVVVQLAEIELLDLPGLAAAALSTPQTPPVANAPQGLEENLFARITTGGRYLQVASVDRGAAIVLAQGLRQRGFKGFLAPGAQEDVYRVMIGPFENSGESQGARVAIAAIGAGASTSKAAR